MYQVYGSKTNRGLRVIWMLEELGQPYELHKDGPGSPAVVALNPSGKVPVLIVGDMALTDSTAILTYLADKHGSLTRAAGSLARAMQDALTLCLLDEVEELVWTAARHSFILPEDRRVPAIKDTLKWEFERNTARLAERIAAPFLMGEVMSVPDILCAHLMMWAGSAKFPAPPAALTEHMTRMQARPAFQRAVAT